MVDTQGRGNGAGETEPVAFILATPAHAKNFKMGAAASQDYNELLAQGVAMPSPGAPIPVLYPGGPSLPARTTSPSPGNRGLPPGDVPPGDVMQSHAPLPSQSVPSGPHTDPRAGWSEQGVPAATGSNIKWAQGFASAPGVTQALQMGQRGHSWAAQEWRSGAAESRKG